MDAEIKAIRELVLGTLDLIADGEGQSRYQQGAPYVNVPAELFNQWDDCYFPEDELFQASFTAEELEAIVQFNKVWSDVDDATPKDLPPLEQFKKTDEWQLLATAAREALSAFDK